MNSKLSADCRSSLATVTAKQHGTIALSLQFIDGLNCFHTKLVGDNECTQNDRIATYVNQRFSGLRFILQRSRAFGIKANSVFLQEPLCSHNDLATSIETRQ